MCREKPDKKCYQTILVQRSSNPNFSIAWEKKIACLLFFKACSLQAVLEVAYAFFICGFEPTDSWGIITISALGFLFLCMNHKAQQHVWSRLWLTRSVKGLAKVNTPARQTLFCLHRSASYLPINHILNWDCTMPWQAHPAMGKWMYLAASNKINMPCVSHHGLRPTPAHQTLHRGQRPSRSSVRNCGAMLVTC